MHDIPRAIRSERNTEESVKVSHQASGAYRFRNNFEQHVVAKQDLQLSTSACFATSSMSGRKRIHPHYLRQLCTTTGRNTGNASSSNVFALTLETVAGAGKLLRGRASCHRNSPTKTGLQYTRGLCSRNRGLQIAILRGRGDDRRGPVGSIEAHGFTPIHITLVRYATRTLTLGLLTFGSPLDRMSV
jgi:hypothetical protein